jgi:hypothetical protein
MRNDVTHIRGAASIAGGGGIEKEMDHRAERETAASI